MGENMALELVEVVLRSELDTCEKKIDLWKQNHKLAMMYFKVCDLVDGLNELFESLTRFDDSFRAQVYKDPASHNEWAESKIDEQFRRWTRLANSLLKELVPWAENEYEPIQGSDTLYRRYNEALGIIADPAEFFQGDALVDARDQAIDEHLNGNGSRA